MELIEQIRKMGLQVEPFVLRVEGVLDLYLPSGKWHDLRTGERGRKPLDQLVHFITQKVRPQAMQREPVESKMIKSLGYDRQGQILEIEFHSGGVYRYFGVKPEDVAAMRDSKSLGSFIAKNVKGKYEHRKVEPDEAETTVE